MKHLHTGDGPSPWLYIKGRLCEMFRCLPSELDGEDTNEILQIVALLNLGNEYEAGRIDDGGS